MNLTRYNFLLLAIILNVATFVHANSTQFTRTITREFQTTPDGTVALYNKYGKVDVRTWSENKVKVDVKIDVVAHDQAAADRVFERINVNFTSSYGYVKAETMISGGSSSWSWGGFWSSVFDNSVDYKINYEVYMPPNNNIDLRNSYGDSYLAAYNGKLIAHIKYGDLKSIDMSNDVDLNLSYGNAAFRSMANLRAQISYGKLKAEYLKAAQADTKYSEMDLRNCQDIRLTSMYDDLKIDAANTLNIQTKYSELDLGKVSNLSLRGQYTDVKIMQLLENLDADVDYGDMTIGSLGDRFTSVRFVGDYCDLKIVTGSPGSSYTFDLNSSYGDLSYPRNATINHSDQNGPLKSLRGKVNAGSGGRIIAKSNYGDITIRN